MFQSCTEKYIDESDEQIFRFVFYCDLCGHSFHSSSIRFTGGREPACEEPSSIKLWRLRWQKEHVQAFRRANWEASLHFFCCPGCGEHVCADCIVSRRIPTGDIRDQCLSCYSKSHEKMRPMQMIVPEQHKKEGD